MASRVLDRFPWLADQTRVLLGSTIRRRVASGAFWGLVSGLAVRMCSVIASFLIARILGRRGFGEYGIIFSTVLLINSLAGLGIGVTATKYIAEFRQTDPARAGRIVGMSTILTLFSSGLYALGLLAFAPWLAEKTLAAPQLTGLLRLSTICAILGVFSGVQASALAGFEAFKSTAIVGLLAGCLQAVLAVIGCWVAGLPGVILGMTLSYAVATFGNHFLLRREMRRFGIQVNWGKSLDEWRILRQFSIPAFLGTAMVAPVFWVCTAMLANQPNGYDELGIFNAANQWYTAVLFLPGVLGTAILPVLSERHGAGDTLATLRVMKGMMKLTAVIVVPIVVIVCLFSKMIMAGYGASFVSGHWTLALTAVTAGLLAVVAPVGQVIAASGRMWTGFLMNAGWAFILIAGSATMSHWGANGIAGGRLLAYGVHTIWVSVFVFHLFRDHPAAGPLAGGDQ